MCRWRGVTSPQRSLRPHDERLTLQRPPPPRCDPILRRRARRLTLTRWAVAEDRRRVSESSPITRGSLRLILKHGHPMIRKIRD